MAAALMDTLTQWRQLVNQHIIFDGIHNFRDLGGIQTENGRKIKKGWFFRSGELGRASTADIQRLASLGIHSIIDFRSTGERMRCPSPEVDGIENLHFPVLPETHEVLTGSSLKEQVIFDISGIPKMYETILIKNEGYASMMRHVCSMRQGGLLFHCTFGKDRTGVAASLILLLLGAAKETVIEQYLRTNDYLQTMVADILSQIESQITKDEKKSFLTAMSAQRSWIEGTLEGIDQIYGSFDDYILQEYHIDAAERERIQALYLE